MSLIRDLARRIYFKIQKNFYLAWFLRWIERIGILNVFRMVFIHGIYDGRERRNPTEDMKKNKEYIAKNRDRIASMLSILADEESRETWKAVAAYLTDKTPIPHRYCHVKCQYFEPLINFRGGVFVDCGAYIGDTIKDFKKYINKRKIYDYRIVAFEADQSIVGLLKKYVYKEKNIKIFSYGVAASNQTLFFRSRGTNSKIVKNKEVATSSIQVVSIDTIEECKDASFIKMDIEGWEMEALIGAKKTILYNKPILAVCIYHSMEDRIRLIEWVYELVPDYRIYVRHHSYWGNETVMYAIPPDQSLEGVRK